MVVLLNYNNDSVAILCPQPAACHDIAQVADALNHLGLHQFRYLGNQVGTVYIVRNFSDNQLFLTLFKFLGVDDAPGPP